MGETASTARGSIGDKIERVNKVNDPFFGKVELFHYTEPPYEYLMAFKKNYINDKQRMAKDLSLLKQVANIEHPNLAKIHHTQVTEGTPRPTQMLSSA